MSQSLNLNGIRTLVVDDEFATRMVLRRSLADWGANVAEAQTGASGIAELARARNAGRPFELVFVDSTMSPVDGFEIVERTRAHPRELERMIVMVGPQRIDQDVPRARALGVSYVAKPLARMAIVGVIATVLSVDTARPSAGPQRPPKRRFRILLAEDNSDVGWIIRTLIEGPDYQVDIAQDGRMAADLFRMADYDLVLMDLHMPNFDGFWAAREIRKWERENRVKHRPIIAVTAFDREQGPLESLRAGLDGYLAKPLVKETLFRVIDKHLGVRHLGSQSGVTTARPAGKAAPS